MSGDVAKWLQSIGLKQYVDAFSEGDIEWDLLSELDHETLSAIGVSSPGHRLRIIKAAKLTGLDTSSHTAVDEATPAKPIASGEAERRQLTVMFCDLANSTELSHQLDPEEMRDINRAYQDACKAAIERYEGYIARYMGDGVLAYFGFPQAHEDDAARAIHAGLGVVEAITHLNGPNPQELSVRVGIATGPVVVGDVIGEGASQENAVVGETPNVAARLQSIAEPNTVMVASATYALVKGQFSFEDAGLRELKGLSDPMQTWLVMAAGDVQSRFRSLRGQQLTALVGRNHEVGLLTERWQQVKDGDGQLALVSGEPGIGKSRVTHVLLESIPEHDGDRLQFQCSPHHTNSAWRPIIETITREIGIEPNDATTVRLDKLTTWANSRCFDSIQLAHFAQLLSIESTGEQTVFDDQQQTLTLLMRYVETHSVKRPLLLLFEDVHWADPSSLLFLDQITQQSERLPIFVILTFRSEFAPPWLARTNTTSVTLNRVGRAHAVGLVNNVAGTQQLSESVIQQIVSRSDGIPLFVEELTRSVLENAREQTSSLPAIEQVPETLHDSLMARLDRLGRAKEIAQIAAAIGREFSIDLLARLVDDENRLTSAMQQLTAAQLVYPGDAVNNSYVFNHALVQDAAYESLLKSRRREIHQNIADVLVDVFPNIVESTPEVVAHHYTNAEAYAAATTYWTMAGAHAVANSAASEAVSHLTQALTSNAQLVPGSVRDEAELRIQMKLNGPLTTAEGWGTRRVRQVQSRIIELSEMHGTSDKIRRDVLDMEVAIQWVDGRFDVMDKRAADFLRICDKPYQQIGATLARGLAEFCLGKFAVALERIERSIELADPSAAYFDSSILDFEVEALGFMAYVKWLLGEPSAARQAAARGMALAKERDYGGTLAWALTWSGAHPAAMFDDVSAAATHTQMLLALPDSKRSPLDTGWAHTISGWARGRSGHAVEGVQEMREGLDSLADTFMPFRSFHLSLLADVHWHAGSFDECQAALDAALQHVQTYNERFWAPEIHRQLGELQRKTGGDAKDYFEKSIALSREMGAIRHERKAADALAALIASQKTGRET